MEVNARLQVEHTVTEEVTGQYPEVEFWSFYANVFNLSRPEPWPRVSPIYSVSFSSMYHSTGHWPLLLIGQKKASSYSLVFTRDTVLVKVTEKRAQVRPTCSIFWTLGAMNRWTPGQVEPIALYFFKKFDSKITTGALELITGRH
jgi:hypothetical protein